MENKNLSYVWYQTTAGSDLVCLSTGDQIIFLKLSEVEKNAC